MNSEFETDSSLSYNYSSSIIKLKIAIRVKPAPQEYSVRSGLPGVAPMVKPAELEVYVESAKNVPLVNEKPPSTYVRASVHHVKYGWVAFTHQNLTLFSRKTGKTERIRNDQNPIWRQTIVYDRIKLVELEEATLTLSIVHRHRARKKLLGKFKALDLGSFVFSRNNAWWNCQRRRGKTKEWKRSATTTRFGSTGHRWVRVNSSRWNSFLTANPLRSVYKFDRVTRNRQNETNLVARFQKCREMGRLLDKGNGPKLISIIRQF